MAKFNAKNIDVGMVEGIANRVDQIEDKAEYNLRQIPLKDIKLNDKNNFGIRDIEDLVESLQKYGQLHNAVVRKIEDPEFKYEMISGERRYRAAEKLGWDNLACKIIAADDVEAEMLLIVANLDTRELNDMEKSQNAQRLAELIQAKRKQGEDFGKKKTREIVAEKMNMAPAQVQKLLKLQNLIPEFKKMVEDKEIGLELANQYAQMTEESQKFVYEKLQEGLKLNAKTAKELKDKLKQAEDDKQKVIDEMKKEFEARENAMKEEIKNTKKEVEITNNELSKKDKLIESIQKSLEELNKELSKANTENERKEAESKAIEEKIRQEIKEELEKSKTEQDSKRLKDLQEKLIAAEKDTEQLKANADVEIRKLKDEIEELKEDKLGLVDEYEAKLKEKEKAEINHENIVKNIEIMALSKEVSKLMSTLIAKIANYKTAEGFELSEDTLKALSALTKNSENIPSLK